jgi:energy-coupling factor transport system substrate-specific component
VNARTGLRLFTPANLFFLILSLAGVAAFLYPFWAPAQPLAAQNHAMLLLFTGAAALILLAIVAEAQSGMTVQSVAMLGALVGLNTALRVIDNVIPLPGGFSPVFLLIILVGYTFGARLGFLMGALTMLVSGPLTAGGIGLWTPYQMLAAGWVGMGAAWLPRRRGVVVLLALYGLAWGWLYGALTNLYFWPYMFNTPDLGWQPGLGLLTTLQRYGRFYLITSLAWDTVGAIGNLLLLLGLGGSLLKALERFRRRAFVVWTPA